VVKQRFKRQAGQERAIITALGWAGGDRLTFTADAGVVTARRDPGGMVTLPASTYITIPAPLRRRCGLEADDQVLLAALPDQASARVSRSAPPTPRWCSSAPATAPCCSRQVRA
jgi:hypothetical protein